MNPTYKKLLKSLRKAYPDKHIQISTHHDDYYFNGSSYVKTTHNVYVEGNGFKAFPTLSEAEKHVRYLCKKEV